jgi:hypothetical protein
MKKIIILSLMLTTIISTSFARDSDNINKQVMTSFTKAYSHATDVKWETQKDFIKATFTQDGQTFFAYYKQNGDLIAITRNMAVLNLPINLSSALKNKLHNDYWLTALFEVASNGETAYYATITNADYSVILKADGSEWVVFKKEKRTDF